MLRSKYAVCHMKVYLQSLADCLYNGPVHLQHSVIVIRASLPHVLRCCKQASLHLPENALFFISLLHLDHLHSLTSACLAATAPFCSLQHAASVCTWLSSVSMTAERGFGCKGKQGSTSCHCATMASEDKALL